ncbi:MAG: glycosyltransferase family 2 protein [Brevinematia bacterium]
MKISVIIPVYREPRLLGDIVEKVLSYDWEEKEVLVVVDGTPTEEINKVLERFVGLEEIKVIYNYARLGKVESLNRAVDLCEGEEILFLDNDVELPSDKDFLKKLSESLGKGDIVEMSKEGRYTNFFSKIVSYDYLGGAIASLISSKVFGKNLFLCGSAFAIRKKTFLELGKFPKVINEDWGLILKTFGTNSKFLYLTDLKVKTEVPQTLGEWINQRKRWSIGMRLWWIEVFKKIYLYFRSFPILFIVGAIFGIPLLVSVITSVFIPNSEMLSVLLSLVVLVGQYLSPAFSVSLVGHLVTYILLALKGVVSLLVSVFLNTLLFFVFSKILKFRFKVFEFVVYSTLYVPFLVSFYIVYGWLVSLFDRSNIDWVIFAEAE